MSIANRHTEIEDTVEKEDFDPTVKLMDKPFNPSLINIDNKLLTIDLLIKRISQKNPEIELNSESYFQRKEDLWDVVQQSRLIESVLIRFPLPAFYFDGTDNNKWLVVDGLQRLSSIRNFVVRKSLKLINLEFLTQLNGKGFDDLDRNLQRIIEETQIVAYIINPGTPTEVKFNIFKRINTGGLILEPQEIRHALNQGPPAKFIAELADLKEFKEATGYSIKTDRMLDRDFANRFLSFYLFDYKRYTPDLDTFMSNAMAYINNMSEEEKEQCKNDFRKSMVLNMKVFSTNAFRKIDKWRLRRNPLNKALFEVFSVIFARLSDAEANELIMKKKEMEVGLAELIENDSEYLKSISSSTGERNRVQYRFKTTINLVKKLIGHVN